MKLDRLFRSIFVLLLIASLFFSPAADAADIVELAIPKLSFLTETYAKLACLGLELRVTWAACLGIFEKS
ncbi:MAG: hypothetical protein P8X81_08835 [Woeseiaceae bacterium]|jgi:hypothetical protein